MSRRLAAAVLMVTAASIVLSFEGMGSFSFSRGSLLVLGAACCWGLENNCTRMLSTKSSVQITTIKGIFSGSGSLMIAVIAGEDLPRLQWIPLVLILGFVSYGLSINFYIQAQKDLGAAKTSAYYAIAPFLGVVFGALLGEQLRLQFYIGLVIMMAATVLMVKDTISLQHTHEHIHTHIHEHSHGAVVHTHMHDHVHTHNHVHETNEDFHEHTHFGPDEHNHVHSSC